MLTFKEETHEYFDGERRIPSVTEILARAGHINPQFYKGTEARERGKQLHELCHRLDVGGEFDWLDYTPEVCEWAKGYEEFLADVRPMVRRSEFIVHSRLYDVGGTCDKEYEIRGELWKMDLKTGLVVPSWTKLQLAMYDICDGADVTKPRCKRAALHLRPSGKRNYRIVPYNDAEHARDYAHSIAIFERYTQDGWEEIVRQEKRR